MNDVTVTENTPAGTDVSAQGGKPAEAETEKAKKVQVETAQAPAPKVASHADKTSMATAIYTVWRNARLRGLPTAAFDRLETESPHLIAAIAAAL